MTEPINLEESDRRFSARPLYRADPDRVLRILAESQFEDPFLAFRELYANALDAVRNKHDARIILQVGADRIAVEDNGPGLDDAGLDALTRLGASTRRGKDAVGRFGIGFASVFDPTLGVQRVRFVAHRQGAAVKGVEIQFVPDLGGGVSITIQPAEVPHLGGSRVEVWFDVSRAPEDRVARTQEVFRTHAAYTGVETELDGQCLGKSLADYIRDEVKSGRIGLMERNIVAASALEGALGVAGIDPGRFDCRVRAYLRGLYVCELIIPRPVGKPWPRGLFGAVNAEGLDLVASRNGFINNQKFKDFLDELQSLGHETAYRVLRHYEATGDSYARVVLLDALRRGLKTSTPETLITGADDIFSCALIRTPLFEAWSESRKFSFEELVDLDREGMFRALSYRPSSDDLNAGVVIRADDSLDRDIFRRLSGMRDMPAAARGEVVSAPGFWSRLQDRFLSGPRAEYSLFRRELPLGEIARGERLLVSSLGRFMHGPEVRSALARLLPGKLPRLGFGSSRNAFGPIAAYRQGEIRFNIRHRVFRRLAQHPDPDRAARGLLPVLAHELAHICHELHDLDFYRTSRTILRTLVTAAANQDAQMFSSDQDE